MKEIADNKVLSLKMLLIDCIYQYARSRGITQKALAETLGTTQPRVSNMLRYDLGKFSLDTLFKYVYDLDIEVKVIIGE